MKVLHLYSGNLFGGIERLLVTLAKFRYLVPEMEPEFALCFRGQVWTELEAEGVPVHDLGGVRFSRPWTVLAARRNLKRLLTSNRYDAAICHAAWPHAVFASTVKAAAVPLTTFAHDTWAGKHWIERWAARTLPNLVIANSRYTAGYIPNVFPNVRTEVVYLPVPAIDRSRQSEIRTEVRRELNTPNDHVVPLFAARLEAWKGPAILIEALGKLRHRTDWTAWLVGGPQKGNETEFLDRLKTRAGELNIADRVRFLGRRSDVPRLMLAADIHCQPNTGGEPFGLAFVEALSAGLPLVTSDIGGAKEIVTPEVGLLTVANDPAATAAAIERLMTNSNERAAMSNSAPARAAALCDSGSSMRSLSAMLLGSRA